MNHILSMAFTENTCSFEKIEGFLVFFKWMIWRPINWLPEHLRNFISLYTEYLSTSKWNSSFFFLISIHSDLFHLMNFVRILLFSQKKIRRRIFGGATIYDMGGGSHKSSPMQMYSIMCCIIIFVFTQMLYASVQHFQAQFILKKKKKIAFDKSQNKLRNRWL